MESKELQDLVDVLSATLDIEKSDLCLSKIPHELDEFESHILIANKEGLQRLALVLLEAALVYDDLQNRKVETAKISSVWSINSDTRISEIVPMIEDDNEPPVVENPTSIKDKLHIMLFIGTIAMILLSFLVGFFTIISWIF